MKGGDRKPAVFHIIGGQNDQPGVHHVKAVFFQRRDQQKQPEQNDRKSENHLSAPCLSVENLTPNIKHKKNKSNKTVKNSADGKNLIEKIIIIAYTPLTTCFIKEG